MDSARLARETAGADGPEPVKARAFSAVISEVRVARQGAAVCRTRHGAEVASLPRRVRPPTAERVPSRALARIIPWQTRGS